MTFCSSLKTGGASAPLASPDPTALQTKIDSREFLGMTDCSREFPNPENEEYPGKSASLPIGDHLLLAHTNWGCYR